jgi:hypothetical protein
MSTIAETGHQYQITKSPSLNLINPRFKKDVMGSIAHRAKPQNVQSPNVALSKSPKLN